MGWLDVIDQMLEATDALRDFAAQVVADGFQSAVLCGMGGSSLAAEVLSRTYGPSPHGLALEVLDTTDPGAILEVERSLDLTRTLFIIASKSGTTLETLSHLAHFWEKRPLGRQFVAITDGGTPLESLARERAFRAVFLNRADIGGRYSALSYFGLVPAALAGIDIDGLLDKAQEMLHACHYCAPAEKNPGAILGAIIGEGARQGLDKLTIMIPAGFAALGDWIEQLIAESTGKEGRGIIPVVGESPGDAGAYANDRLFVSFGDAAFPELENAGHPVVRLPLADPRDLGAQFFLWEFATAVAGHVLGVNPFDQPNVEEAKAATARLLSSGGSIETPAPPGGRLRNLVRQGDYISIQAYVTPSPAAYSALQNARALLRDRFHVATTAGYGPRFLHSTGQLHKGGPDTAVVIQILGHNASDLQIPGRPYTFGALKRAQAAGDLESQLRRGRRVLAIEVGADEIASLDLAIEALT